MKRLLLPLIVAAFCGDLSTAHTEPASGEQATTADEIDAAVMEKLGDLYGQGQALLRLGQRQRARSFFNQMLALDESSLAANLALFQLDCETYDIESALRVSRELRDIDRAVRESGEEPFLPLLPMLAKGWMRAGFEHTGRAVELLLQFQHLHSEAVDESLVGNLGWMLTELGYQDKAIALYRSHIARFPGVRLKLATALFQRGDLLGLQEAHMLFNELHEANPTRETFMRLAQLAPLKCDEDPDPLPAQKVRNGYAGYTVPSHDHNVARLVLDADDSSSDDWRERATEAFRGYVRRRQPVVISTAEGSAKSAQQLAGWDTGKWLDSPKPIERIEQCGDLSGLPELAVEKEGEEGCEGEDGDSSSIISGRLRELAGSDHVYALRRPRGDNRPFGFHQERRITTLSAVLDNIASHEGDDELYIATQHKRQVYQPPLESKELRSDIPLPFFIPEEHVMEQVTLWLGAAAGDPDAGIATSVSSRLHHDKQDNVLGLLSGRKTYALYSPADVAKMYPVGDVASVHRPGKIVYEDEEAYGNHFTMIDPRWFSEDDAVSCGAAAKMPAKWPAAGKKKCADKARMCAHARFPLFAEAKAETVTLEPGEFLYIPEGWYHSVESSSPGPDTHAPHMAVNWWFTAHDITFNI